ncbi:MAG: hypothetical protein WD492_06945 [Alkalispirochaeta sp.]
MTRAQAENLAQWLQEEADALDYGEITVTITRHDSQTRQIEKSVTVKERPEQYVTREEVTHRGRSDAGNDEA